LRSGYTERSQRPWPRERLYPGGTIKKVAIGLYRLKELGIDLHVITEKLPLDCISAFAASFEKLLAAVEEKRRSVVAAGESHAGT